MRKTYKAFSAGEVSRDMYGRFDVDKYGSGCMILLNNVIMAQGGVYSRPGMRYLAAAGDSSKRVKLIPFEFSTIQSYDLEFGDEYMRVFRDGAQVLEASQSITSVSQASPGVVTKNAHGYSNGQEVYLSGVTGMTELNGRNFKIAGATANTFTLLDIFGNPVNTTAYGAFTAGTMARVYQITSPFGEAELFELYYAQTADVMTIVHEDYDVIELTRTGHTSWTFSTVVFAPSITRPSGVAAVVGLGSGAVVYKYKVTAIMDETFEESLPGIQATKAITAITQANPASVTANAHGYATGDEVLIEGVVGMTDVNGNYYKIVVTGANTFTLTGVNSTGYPAYVSGGTVGRTTAEIANNLSTSGNFNTVSWQAVPGAVKYSIYKDESGTYGFIGSSESLSFKDDNIEPAVGNTPPRARNPFFGAGNKPSVVSFQQQRRVFAATLNKPDTIWMSRAGQYRNMSVSIPNRSDDAITFAIASGQVNKINHLLAFRDLLALTVAQEWKIGANGGAYTPTTMVATPETNYGSQGDSFSPRLKPIMIGNTAIMASKYGRSVRDYGFTFEADGYEGNDLSVLSKHLLEDRFIVDWAFAQEPDKLIWAVMSDGALCSLTYMREHRVWGWARHETQGFVESVSVTPDPQNRRDAVTFLVRRNINGQSMRYIERLERFINKPIVASYFVDSGLSYSGAPITTVNGLEHLEGADVWVLADGNFIDNLSVSNRSITLPRPASTIHIGLGYDCILQPLPTESDSGPFGATKGEPKRIKTLYVETDTTRGLEVTQSPDGSRTKMVPVFPDLDMAATIEGFTGIAELLVESTWDQNYTAPYVYKSAPVPSKILTLTPVYD